MQRGGGRRARAPSTTRAVTRLSKTRRHPVIERFGASTTRACGASGRGAEGAEGVWGGGVLLSPPPKKITF